MPDEQLVAAWQDWMREDPISGDLEIWASGHLNLGHLTLKRELVLAIHDWAATRLCETSRECYCFEEGRQVGREDERHYHN